MKVLKFSAFALASVMALAVVGCGPQVDPKVKFMSDCKEKLTPDECRRIADEKAFEDQQRLALRQQQLQQPTQNYSTNQMPPAHYDQTGYVAPAPATAYVQPAPTAGGGFVESMAGAAVGGAVGAAVGNALTNKDRQYQNTSNYNQSTYQQPKQQYQPARATQVYQQPKQQYQAPKQQYQAPKQTTQAPRPGAFSSAPSTTRASAPAYKPAAKTTTTTRGAFAR